MRLRAAYKMVVAAIIDFGADDAATYAASLSFYTTLSLAPLLIILTFILGIISPHAQEQLVREVQSLVGSQAGNIIRVVIDNAQLERKTGLISAIIGSITVLISATAVFGELQTAMNQIWNVQAKPGSSAVWGWIRKRLLSLGMVAGIGFLLVVSLAISTALHLLLSLEHRVWVDLDNVISLFIYSLIFSLLFKVLPDAKIHWRDVGVGAVITAMLFMIGKWAISKYLGFSGIGSAYGAAGSLVVLLVWVYYSSIIVFFGAELAQAYVRSHGTEVTVEDHARTDLAAKMKKTPLDPDEFKPE